MAENLRAWGTGELRRLSDETPFLDVIASGQTPARERRIAPHPSVKPQAFLRHLVSAALPIGCGIILDTFAGCGSTLAACEAEGLEGIGIEIDPEYFEMATRAVPKLAALNRKQGRQYSFDDREAIAGNYGMTLRTWTPSSHPAPRPARGPTRWTA